MKQDKKKLNKRLHVLKQAVLALLVAVIEPDMTTEDNVVDHILGDNRTNYDFKTVLSMFTCLH